MDSSNVSISDTTKRKVGRPKKYATEEERKEALKAAQRRYYESHRQERTAESGVYYREHLEKRQQYGRDYYHQHKPQDLSNPLDIQH